MTTRRQLLGAAGAASALLSLKPGWAQPSGKPLRNMGGAPAGFPVRSRASRGGAKPFDFVEYCHSLGFGVVETRLPPNDPESIKAFRQKIEAYNMRVILDVGYPRDEAGVAAFDASVKAAKECGAISLHAAMTARRYEEFAAFDTFKQSFERAQNSIASPSRFFANTACGWESKTIRAGAPPNRRLGLSAWAASGLASISISAIT